jgi:uncharacterized protein (TIGR02421 family)
MRISEQFISRACKTVGGGRLLRRNLPIWGRIHIDRQQPFLCVYRRPVQREDHATENLLRGQASYLLASGESDIQDSLTALVQNLGRTLATGFGVALVLELWSTPQSATPPTQQQMVNAPDFRLIAPRLGTPHATLESLEIALLAARWHASPKLKVDYVDCCAPPGLPALLSPRQANEAKCVLMGLEVNPFYRDPHTNEILPVILMAACHGLGWALKQAFYTFSHNQASYRPAHFHELGRTAVTPVVWDVDRSLAKVGDSYDLLLHTTPVNNESAWQQFKRQRYQQTPEFLYRPHRVEPAILKRELYKIPIELIEDPTLHHLFAEKRDEMDRKITMLGDRETARFLYGSQQVYGIAEDDLRQLAEDILAKLPVHAPPGMNADMVDAEGLAQQARKELEYYQQSCPELEATVQIREDVPGIMVSQGHLLIGHTVRVATSWVEASIQHEIGTHVLTYHNGLNQPFQLFHTGMAGYEALQEGLAVLSEFLVGGLNHQRLRLLAGRIIAVHHLVQGASFVENFYQLRENHGFEAKTAYNITMRIYRGGGFTKDVVYLRGLRELLVYLAKGGSFEELLLGRISLGHINLVEELKWRKILKTGPLRPRYLADSRAIERLNLLKKGVSVLDLISEA